ncbi:MAG: hypothetical protein QXS20_08060 [Candidatus Thorarchaeota archaeon]
MVRGPCRGGQCDYWARVRLKKASDDELVQDAIGALMHDSITLCTDDELEYYWKRFGIKSIDRLRYEEPSLFEKIERVSRMVTDRIRTARCSGISWGR